MVTEFPAKSADLSVRAVSAAIMLVVAGAALALGGWWWTVFVLIVAMGVWFEWSALCLLMFPPGRRRTGWRYAGSVYCGIGAAVLLALRDIPGVGTFWILMIVGAVVATDVGAYLFGRAIGGPKIAPKISPSKTWAGLIGGMFGAALMCATLVEQLDNEGFVAAIGARDSILAIEDTPMIGAPAAAILGAFLAIVAQAGDFFESWMKRRAGVKDSGRLLPGHGGLFDRVDGLLAVCVVLGIVLLVFVLFGGGPAISSPP